MGILDYFRPVSSWKATEVRAFLQGHPTGACNLLDVRQPLEYAEGHLPGAKLIPLAELAARLDELARDKPTVVYCATGVRSRAATVLSSAGFRPVHSLRGGIRAWRGLVAEGAPEPEIARFTAAGTLEACAALAWLLEEGTRAFYAAVGAAMRDLGAAPGDAAGSV